MARYRKEFTLSKDTIEYLKNSDNASRTIDEAVELHKNHKKIPLEVKEVPKPKVKIVG